METSDLPTLRFGCLTHPEVYYRSCPVRSWGVMIPKLNSAPGNIRFPEQLNCSEFNGATVYSISTKTARYWTTRLTKSAREMGCVPHFINAREMLAIVWVLRCA